MLQVNVVVVVDVTVVDDVDVDEDVVVVDGGVVVVPSQAQLLPYIYKFFGEQSGGVEDEPLGQLPKLVNT